MCTPRASNADEPPEEDNRQPSSLLSLPEEIVLSCLARVPRNCHLNLALVSKTLRSLVCSPELNQLRSLLHKNSIYLCFRKDATTFRWLTLRSKEKPRTSTIEYYGFVPISFPSHSFMHNRLTVTVGSEMYFLGRSSPSDLWIIDTRSGKLTQGPSMKGVLTSKVMGVIDGKIYVIGFAECHEKIQVEVFDPETRIWKSVGQEEVPPIPWCWPSIASLEGKIYIVERGRTSVYSPREGRRKRMVHMVNERLAEYGPREGGTKEMLNETVNCVCVVENVLYACFAESGLMWFDTKLKTWRRLLIHDENDLSILSVSGMSEYDGKLAVFKSLYDKGKSVKMFLIPLHMVGQKICGTIEWSGIVTTNSCICPSIFRHCLVGSDGTQYV